MPRKLAPMRYAHGPTYKDWPECLTDYAWLVKEGLRSPEKMYNLCNTLDSVCKPCGARSKRSEMALHVQEHAAQLGLAKAVEVIEATPEQANLLGDIEAVVEGTLESWHADENGQASVEFDLSPEGLLPELVAAIVGDVMEQDGTCALCNECQS